MQKKITSIMTFMALVGLLNAQVLTEDFSSTTGTTLPTGWSQATVATDGGWKIGVGSTLASTYFGVPDGDGNVIVTNDDGCNCDKSADRLVLPAVDLSGITGGVMLLYDKYYFNNTYQSATETLVIEASTDGGATWTAVADVAPNTSNAWELGATDIAAYAGQANVTFSFLYNDGGDWLYGAGLDNISIGEIPQVINAQVTSATIGKLVAAVPAVLEYDKVFVGTNLKLEGTIKNTGGIPITSFDAVWTDGTNTNTMSVTGVNIPFLGTYAFQHDNDATAVLGANNLSLTITNINGSDDIDMTDNTYSKVITGVTKVTGRGVIAEEGTGTWCPWCVRGDVYMDYMADNYDDFYGIAVHNADPMTVTAYDAAIGNIISGYPSGVFDRHDNDVDPSQFEASYIDRMTTAPKISIAATAAMNETTRELTIDVDVNFLQALNGNYRLNAVLTEDGVTGTTSTWAQANAYAGGGVGPMGGYENLPGSIPAAQMTYDHVARAILGDWAGEAGSVPSSNAAGTSHSHSFTTVVANTWDETKMHVVVFLTNSTGGEVENATSTSIGYVGTRDILANNRVNVYPNPMVDEATIAISMEIPAAVSIRLMNAIGQELATRNYGELSGDQKLPLLTGNLPTGIYTVQVTMGDKIAVKKINVVR